MIRGKFMWKCATGFITDFVWPATYNYSKRLGIERRTGIMGQMQKTIRRRAGVSLGLLLTFSAMLVGCSKPAPPAAPTESTQVKRFHMVGKIVSIDAANSSLTIDHQAIPGFMDAMTMGYTVRSAQTLTGLAAGDEITADVVVPDQGTLYLENIMVTKKGSSISNSTTDNSATAATHEPQPGERVPDFAFINQDGKRIHLSSFRGDALLVTFIYTRCPYPEYCPLVSKNFAHVYAASRGSATAAKVRLLSVSFDPQHDTPEVLKKYAETMRQTAGGPVFDRWEFVAAPPSELKEVANFFGLYFSETGGQIVHSMSTTVIAPDGTVSKWYRDNAWAPADILADANVTLREPDAARAQLLAPSTASSNVN
jgi:protein SCO1/2